MEYKEPSRARYSSEEAVEQVGNRYSLIIAASARARQIKNGSMPKILTKSTDHRIIALEEIESGVFNE